MQVDPVLVLLGERHLRAAVRGIGKQQLKLVLLAVQSLDGQALAVAQPVHAGNVDVRIAAGVDPARVGSRRGSSRAGHGHNAHAHNGVGVAGDGIAHRLGLAGVGEKVDQRIFGHRLLVHLQISNLGRVRRPPVGRADVQLLRINPVELPIPQLFATAVRQLLFLARGHAHRPKVVAAHEAHPAAVGRELRVVNRGFVGILFRPRRRQLLSGFLVQVKPVERVRRNKQQCVARGRPEVALRRDSAQTCLLVLRAAGFRQDFGQHLRVHQPPALTGGRVQPPDFGLGFGALSAPLKITEQFSVRAPLQAIGQ